MKNTIPTQTDAMIAFMANVAVLLTATPTAFGLEAGDATAFTALLSDAQDARAARETAVNDAKSKTVALEGAGDALMDGFRAMAASLRVNDALSDEVLATIGVFRRGDATPIVAPGEAPVLAVERLNVGSAVISARQVGGSRARPAGTIGYELSLVNGVLAPVEGEANTGTKRFSPRSLITVATDIGAPRIRLYARTVTPRGEYSPWSLPVTFNPQT